MQKKGSILIVQAPYYQEISKMLLDGAVSEIKKHDFANGFASGFASGFDFEIVDVAGALEIPAAISMASKSNKNYTGFIALGCVIRGETSHYETVCEQSAYGLNILAINQHLAIGNGILTVENEKQAIARADKNDKDKGGFAAAACISMIKLKEKFKLN